MADPSLEALLCQLTVADNDAISQAEAQIAKVSRDAPHNLVPELASILLSSENAGARHMASVLLRQRIPTTWTKLPPKMQDDLKKMMLDRVVVEQKGIVASNLEVMVAAVAKFELPAQRWPELLGFLASLVASQEARHRVVAVRLLKSVLSEDVNAFALRKHHKSFLDMISGLLRDTNLEVSGNAVQLLTVLVPHLGSSAVQPFRQLVEPAVMVIRRCLTENEDLAMDALDFLEECSDTEVPLIKPFLPPLLQLATEIGTAFEQLSEAACIKGWTFVHCMIVRRPKAIVKNKLLPDLLQNMFKVLVSQTPEEDEDEDEVEGTLYAYILQIMAEVSNHVPPELILPPVSGFVENCLSSPDPKVRRAGFDAASSLVEGCSYYIQTTSNMDALLQLVFGGMADPHEAVRRAACVVLSRMAQYCQPDITSRHSVVLPRLMACLTDTSSEVRERSCYALERFVENMDSAVIAYLNDLMAALNLMTSQGDDAHQVAISCIGAVALASKDRFLPYFDTVMSHLKQLMQITDPEKLDLVCQVFDSAGVLATSTRSQAFAPHIHEVVDLSLRALEQMDDPDLRVACFSLYGSLSDLLGDDFATIADKVLPRIFESCERAATAGQDATGTPEGDDDDFLSAVHTSEHYESEAAFQALAGIGTHSPRVIAPHLAPALALCEAAMQRKHLWQMDGIRQSVLRCLLQLAGSMFATSVGLSRDASKPVWQPGLPLSFSVDDEVLQVMATVLRLVLPSLQQEVEKKVVCEVLDGVQDLLMTCGPACFVDESVLQQFAGYLQSIFQQQARCQQEDFEGEDPDFEEDEDDRAELDHLLAEYAAEALTAMAKVLGPQFMTLAGPFFMLLGQAYHRRNAPDNERSMAIGTVGELIEALGNMVEPLFGDLVKLLLAAHRDQEPEVRSNAMFATGVLCEHAPTAADAKIYQTILQSMFVHSLSLDTSQSEEAARIKDNACGALARMMLARADLVPLAEVLPALFGAMPLQADLEEVKTVYRGLHGLASSSNQALRPVLQRVLECVAADVTRLADLPEGTEAILSEFVRSLATNYSVEARAALQAAPAGTREVLSQFFS